MSRRRYRFLTDPRIFSFFTEPCINRVQFFLTFIIVLPIFSFGMSFFQRGTEQEVHEKRMQALADARAEVRALKAAEAKRNSPPLSTPASMKIASETETPTPATRPPDDNGVAMPDDTVEVMQSGPLKGVPLDVAKEIQEEYRVASMERATRYHEWDQRRRDHHKRDMALVEKELAHGDALLADSKERREHILAVYASMSPEQLETARKEALETQPAEFVELFFRHVSEFRTSKSPEQINQAAQGILRNKETLAIERQAWKAEREQLSREREQLNSERDEILRTKPPSPNIDFNEFYTEWKERNPTKLPR